jgi:hypothetical protein
MTVPHYDLKDIAPQAHEMANKTKNERVALTLQCVAIGSMIVMAAATAAHVIKDLFRNTNRHDRSR